jgi:hypothetical protein
MNEQHKALVRRRDLFRAAVVGAAAAAANTAIREPAAAAPSWSDGKRKARYQASSAEVQEFYRVNRYPKR